MSRAKILKAIQNNKPSHIPLPDSGLYRFSNHGDLLSEFEKRANLAGAKLTRLANTEIAETLQNIFPNAQKVLSLVPELKGNCCLEDFNTAQELAALDVVVVHGAFGVAENAAIWLNEELIQTRVLPFITDKLVIVLSIKDIVDNMHSAYALLAHQPKTFGVFISGPSKTADIEQSLVIGAHGAVQLDIFLTLND